MKIPNGWSDSVNRRRTENTIIFFSPCYASWHIGQGQVSSTLLCCWLFFTIVPQVYPLSFISFSMMRLHIVFGLPLFLCPSGVHFRATIVISSDGLRRTWPRKYNGQEKKDKGTNNYLQNTTHKTKDQVIRAPLNPVVELMRSGRVGSSCFKLAYKLA